MPQEIFERKPLAIAVIHLPNLRKLALEKRVDDLVEFVERECRIIEDAGFDAVIVENFNDKPYGKVVERAEVLGLASIALHTARRNFSGFVGLSLLRCSAIEAYRIAYSLGGHFIRVNTVAETIITESGIIEPQSYRLAELKDTMPGVKVFGDIMCKHSGSLDCVTRFITKLVTMMGIGMGLSEVLRECARELILDASERSCADALIITGGRTGEAPPLDFVKFARDAAKLPIIIGSGMKPDNICKYLEYCDGVIVGSYIKEGGKAGGSTNPERARRMIETIRRCAKSS